MIISNAMYEGGIDMYGWVRYNNIIKNAEKGDVVVNLDAVLEKLGKGVGFRLRRLVPILLR